jgi:hypothetical protein
MMERAYKLINHDGYDYLLALRDLYDAPRRKKRDFINGFNSIVSNCPFRDQLSFNLAIMEIEAWFLADPDLFSRLHGTLTPQFIYQQLHIDLKRRNPENFDHPAETINRILQLANSHYKKRKDQVYSLTHRLDYELLCDERILNKVKSWNHFYSNLAVAVAD